MVGGVFVLPWLRLHRSFFFVLFLFVYLFILKQGFCVRLSCPYPFPVLCQYIWASRFSSLLILDLRFICDVLLSLVRFVLILGFLVNKFGLLVSSPDVVSDMTSRWIEWWLSSYTKADDVFVRSSEVYEGLILSSVRVGLCLVPDPLSFLYFLWTIPRDSCILLLLL